MLFRTAAWVATIMMVGCAATAADRPTTASTPADEASASPQPRSAADPEVDAPAADTAAGDVISVELPERVAKWADPITVAAHRHGVPVDLVALVVWIESNGNPDAVSSMGARGLMQLMPKTAAAVAERQGVGPFSEAQLLDPETNLDLGAAHLAELIAAYATDGLDLDAVERVSIAYNGGARVLANWQRGEALPQETERYAARMRERWSARP